MREIVLDTETTGFEPSEGHRIVEIGCVEIINKVPTGKTCHLYINPERDMPPEAQKIHGLSAEFLSTFPVFAEIADEFLTFIADDPLVIHNAAFDMKFINAELAALRLPVLPNSRAIDTLMIARRKFPGAQASLDALCRRFQIDNSNRTLHGALLDAELLAEVYLELGGGREPGLSLGANASAANGKTSAAKAEKPVRAVRAHDIPEAERQAHQKAIASLEGALWIKMRPDEYPAAPASQDA